MKWLFFQVMIIILLINIYSFESSSCCKTKRKKVYKQLYNATERTLTSLGPPLCHQIILNETDAESQYISSKGLGGRISPVGIFETTLLALEYLYGILCPVPGLPALDNVIQSFELKSVAYDKDYLKTQSEFVILLTNSKRLTFYVQMAFDEEYKLCGYEGVVRNLGLTLDEMSPEERTDNIAFTCAAVQQFCTGELQQYNSTADCIDYLTTQIPYGTLDRADQGSVSCRIIHIRFIPLAPEIHCPHVGPSGGGKCSDKTYQYQYNTSITNFLQCAHRYSCED